MIHTFRFLLAFFLFLCSACAQDGLDTILSVNDGSTLGGASLNGATLPDGSPNPDADSSQNNGGTTSVGQGGGSAPSSALPNMPSSGNNDDGSNGGTVGSNPGGSNGGSPGSTGGTPGENSGGSNNGSAGNGTSDPDAGECLKMLGKNAKLIVVNGNQKSISIQPYGLAMIKVTGNKCSLKVQSPSNQPVGGLCIFTSGNQSEVDIDIDAQVDHFYYKGCGDKSHGRVNVLARGRFSSSVKVDLKGNQNRLEIQGNGYNYSGCSR